MTIKLDNSGAMSKIPLFLLTLLLAIFFNSWIQWNSSTIRESCLNDIDRKVDMIREKLKKLIDIKINGKSNNKITRQSKMIENQLEQMVGKWFRNFILPKLLLSFNK